MFKLKGTNQKSLQSGSVTIEAAITFPCFIVLVVFFIAIIQIFIVYMDVQNSINSITNKVSVNINNSVDYIGLKNFFINELSQKGYKNINGGYYMNKSNCIYNIDFSNSIIDSKEGRVYLSIRYTLKSMLVNKIFPKLLFEQRSCVKAFAMGRKYKYMWNSNHLIRGIQIQEIFGKNVVDIVNSEFFKFDISNNQAIEMRTLNPTLSSYQNPGEIIKTGKVDLVKFGNFNDVIQVYNKGTIKSYNIESKKFLLVIPEDTRSQSFDTQIEEIKTIAREFNIIFELIEYGTI